MRKRLICMMLVLAMIVGTMSAFAAPRPYSPGIWEQTQELGDAIEVCNASAVPGNLELQAGGFATYDFTLTFDAGKMTVNYEATQTVNLTVTTELNEYSAVLTKDETSVDIALTPERMGAFKVTIGADRPVTIKKIVYDKQKIDRYYRDNATGMDEQYLTPVEYVYNDPYEEAMRSTVVIPENSNTINVKNALRRVDYDDPTITTKILNGSLYAPIQAFAHAFSLYFEDYQDLDYAYMSGENFAWYYKEGTSWYENTGLRVDMVNQPIHLNGITYVPVREIAEAMDKTVVYKEGYALIGMRTEIRNIVETTAYWNSLRRQMSKFITDGSPVQGNTYHVAKTSSASDSNPGTEEFPFATVQYAVDMAVAGDTVIVHDGVYRERVQFNNDGTALAPITIKAAEGENPTISAFEEVTGFAPYVNPQNGVEMYTKDVSNLEFEVTPKDKEWTYDRNWLLYNGKTLLEGRHPNSETSTERMSHRTNYRAAGGEEDFLFAKVTPFNPYYPDMETNEVMPTRGDMRFQNIIGKGQHQIYTHELISEVDLNQTQKDYWKGATVIALVGMAWQLVSGVVDSSEYGKAYVNDDWYGQFTMTYYDNKYASDYAWLTHHINTVDMPGEWFLDTDSKILYIIPPEGQDIETFVPEVKARQQVLDLTERKYIQIENINTRGGGMTMHNAEGCILNGGTHKYISQYDTEGRRATSADTFYYFNKANNGRNDSSMDAKHFGESGFYMGGKNNAIINSDIQYSAGAGIKIEGAYNYCYNNYVANNGWGCTYMAGIYIGNSFDDANIVNGGHAIISNTSTGAYRAAISAGSGALGNSGVLDNTNTSLVRPMAALDIGYNEFSWSNIAARDTGVQYFSFFHGGDSQEMTKMHHNFIHDAVGPRTDSIMSANIYMDGGVSGIDDYNNIAYCTSPEDVYRAKNYYYWDGYEASELGYMWGNWSDEYGHEDGLKMDTSIWPNGLAFKAGTDLLGERFMDNYNNVQRSEIQMLGQTELVGNTYIDENDYVVIPDKESSIEGNLSLGEEGTIITVYFSEDKYNKTPDTCPVLAIDLYKDEERIHREVKTIAGFGRYLDSGSKVKFYVPGKMGDDVKFRLTSDKDSMRFRKISATPFDYDYENSRRAFPYTAQHVPMGFVDEVIQGPEKHTYSRGGWQFLDSKMDDLTYSSIGDTWDNTLIYRDIEITSPSDNVVYVGSSNYVYSRCQVDIFATNKETGEEKKIGYVDCSKQFPQGVAWHMENIPGVLYDTLEPGVYDFRFEYGYPDETVDGEARALGSVTAHAMVFF